MKETPYDKSGTASHYDDQRINMTHLIEAIWGTEGLITFHEINAFKYRMRIGKKDDPNQELTKIKWTETMVKFLRNKSPKIKGVGVGDLPLYEEFLKMLEDEKQDPSQS